MSTFDDEDRLLSSSPGPDLNRVQTRLDHALAEARIVEEQNPEVPASLTLENLKSTVERSVNEMIEWVGEYDTTGNPQARQFELIDELQRDLPLNLLNPLDRTTNRFLRYAPDVPGLDDAGLTSKTAFTNAGCKVPVTAIETRGATVLAGGDCAFVKEGIDLATGSSQKLPDPSLRLK